MRYSMADAEADAADADYAQELAANDEVTRQEHKARERALFQEKFNRIFSGIQVGERLPFTEWIITQHKILAEANQKKKLAKSDARIMILKAIAYCPDFCIDQHRDETEVYSLIEIITVPGDAPGWGKIGRPSTLKHRIYRLVEDGLLKATTPEGQKTEKLTVTPLGALHLHHSGHFSGLALLGYYRWATDTVNSNLGRPAPVWDNPLYLDYREMGTTRDEEYQFKTPGASKWASLRSLHNDPWSHHTTGRLEIYDLSHKQLSNMLSHIYEGNVDECLKIIDGGGGGTDRHDLIEEILKKAGITNGVALTETISRLERGPYAIRVQRLIDYYQAEHPNEDANNVIGELIIRSAWVVVRQIMDHRMNDDYSNDVIERANQGDPDAIHALEEYKVLQDWWSADDYEPEDRDR